MMVMQSSEPYMDSSWDSDWIRRVTAICFSRKIEMYSGKFSTLEPVAKSSQSTSPEWEACRSGGILPIQTAA